MVERREEVEEQEPGRSMPSDALPAGVLNIGFAVPNLGEDEVPLPKQRQFGDRSNGGNNCQNLNIEF